MPLDECKVTTYASNVYYWCLTYADLMPSSRPNWILNDLVERMRGQLTFDLNYKIK